MDEVDEIRRRAGLIEIVGDPSWVSMFSFDVHVYKKMPDGTREHIRSHQELWPQMAEAENIIRNEMKAMAKDDPTGEAVFVIHAKPYNVN